jgi:chorismate-pyruvate lyase
MEPATLPPESARSLQGELAHPLDEFYARNGQALPPLQRIDGVEVPEPYRSLLVHESDMTSTLEAFHGGRILLEVLGRKTRGQAYFREVILRVAETREPIEFGAIKIHLDLFPEEVRQKILEEEWPLGRILKENGLAFTSSPQAYLRIASDKIINKVLELSGAQLLFGRRNTIYNETGQPLAEIVEILPPLRAGWGKRHSASPEH